MTNNDLIKLLKQREKVNNMFATNKVDEYEEEFTLDDGTEFIQRSYTCGYCERRIYEDTLNEREYNYCPNCGNKFEIIDNDYDDTGDECDENVIALHEDRYYKKL